MLRCRLGEPVLLGGRSGLKTGGRVSFTKGGPRTDFHHGDRDRSTDDGRGREVGKEVVFVVSTDTTPLSK